MGGARFKSLWGQKQRKRKWNASCLHHLYLYFFLFNSYIANFIYNILIHTHVYVYIFKTSLLQQKYTHDKLTISFMQVIGRESVYYFHDMIVEMTKWGFQEGKTLFGFGYDFRQSNRYLPIFTFSWINISFPIDPCLPFN